MFAKLSKHTVPFPKGFKKYDLPRQVIAWSAGGLRTLRAQAALKTSRAQGGPPTMSTPGATCPLYLS